LKPPHLGESLFTDGKCKTPALPCERNTAPINFTNQGIYFRFTEQGEPAGTT
jgi:hypothetical protein